MITKPLLSLLAICAVALNTAFAANPQKGLDDELTRTAAKIIQLAKEKGYRNVGVLKFRVKKGDADFSDSVGPLNMTIADRLEIALLMANPNEEIGIIERASNALVEAGNRRANHLTAEGRTALFAMPFPLAWGNRDVTADAFVTGDIIIPANLQTMTVKLSVITKEVPDPSAFAEFSVSPDARTLAEVGESFFRRGGFDKGSLVVTSTAKLENPSAKHPLEESPITLKVLYDGKAAPIRFEKGKAVVDEPQEGQEVSLALENVGSEQLGVVLSCNGFNTLFKERTDPSLSHKWILNPGDQVTVRGYQMDDRTLSRFKVLSSEESKANEIKYNPDVGTLGLAVFRAGNDGGTSEEGAAPENKDQLLVSRAIQSGTLPSVKPGSLKALQGKLKADAGTSTETLSRGLVTAGDKVGGTIKRVGFKAEPIPILSATVYYKRR